MSSGQYTPGTDGQPDPAGQVPAVPDHEPAAPATEPQAGTAETRKQDSRRQEPRQPATRPAEEPKVTRAGVVWAAVVASLVLLILLIIFILQNQDQVLVRYFGLEGQLPLGMALFIASVTGGVLVAAAGGVRILQLRATAHRTRAANRR
ncbi:hypothetical protein ACU18_01205 [Arthrobacter sp. ZBG10]|uniref:LapA family protein n=1 Tax=Micrococcaceae TaxID=1268 RepID=UPI0006833A31|nr:MULTISPECIES: lipopolysaccharide assembly protein LapA domain-containing protein [Micrococcaceae]KNH22512.1 hypothetical protein ACU18_01205 [Arthrobacter sp. ZBG10]